MTTRYALGAIPSTEDPRDHQISRYAAVPLPAIFLNHVNWTRLNQGLVPACIGFSGALDAQVGTDVIAKDLAVFDGLDLYRQCKLIDGGGTDGTSVRFAIQVRMNLGTLAVKAVSGPIKPGQREKITAYARLRTLADIKTAIVAYGGAWIASNWSNSWFTPIAATNTLPKFTTNEGGHGYYFVGYRDDHANPDGTRGAFLLQNSWGNSWGHSGRAWYPYSYLTPSIGWEAWRTIPAPVK